MGTVEHINPEDLHANPAFTNVITVSGPAKTIYIGGQNAVTVDGEIVGKGDIAAQAEQVLANLETALAAAGAGPQHLVRLGIYIVQGLNPMPAFEVFRQRWGMQYKPATITVLTVVGLANPDFLLEIEAVGIVPEG